MSVYYNEWDAYPAQWLRNLSDAGHIANGTVDERSIKDIRPEDLSGYKQAHFFAGIGGWSIALRLAGVPDDAAVWTGSCPCQPFSQAGKRRGVDDERHLWPEFFRLIRECRPPVVFGEQVAGKSGLLWLSAVRADMEGIGYVVGAANLCAAGIGAPHIIPRLYWGAHSNHLGNGGAWNVAQQVSPESHFSRFKDVRRVEDYRNRPGIPEPVVRLLSDGLPRGLERLRAYGNAIVPPLAAEFVKAYMQARGSLAPGGGTYAPGAE